MFLKKSCYFNLVAVFSVFQAAAFAAETKESEKTQAKEAAKSGDTDQKIAAQGAQALGQSPAVGPGKGMLRIGYLNPWVYGFWKEMYVGSHISNLLSTHIQGPVDDPGKWLFSDGLVGLQLVGEREAGFTATIDAGMRNFSYEDSNSRLVKSSGAYGHLNLAFDMGAGYTQGLSGAVYLGAQEYNLADKIYGNEREDDDARRALGRLYNYSHRFPLFSAELPASFAVTQASGKSLDLEGTFQFSALLVPRYTQNKLDLKSWLLYTEQTYGVLGAGHMTYSYKPHEARGYSTSLTLGARYSASKSKKDTRGKRVETELTLPGVPQIQPVVDFTYVKRI